MRAASLPNAFAPARRISAENSGSFTARASTIAPTIPLIVASAFSRRAAAERPVTNVVRTSMKSRRPLVKVTDRRRLAHRLGGETGDRAAAPGAVTMARRQIGIHQRPERIIARSELAPAGRLLRQHLRARF